MLEVASIALSIMLAVGGFLCCGCCCFSCGRKGSDRFDTEEKKIYDKELQETGQNKSQIVEADVHHQATDLPDHDSKFKDIESRRQMQETEDDINDEIRELPENCTTWRVCF